MVDRSKMQYRHLGRSGLLVSTLSFGNWVTGHDPAIEEIQFDCIKAAIENGVNFFDTAEIYGFGNAETVMGNIFKRGGWDRDDLVVSTKFIAGALKPNSVGLSRKHLVQGMHNSLKRLQLDFVDIMFLHRPDYETPLRETLHAVNHLIEKGKADYWGLSEFSPERIVEIYRLCDKLGYPYPIAEQSQYNMFWRERVETELYPFYDQYGLGTTVWSPLAGGILSGKYNDGNTPPDSRLATIDNEMVRRRYQSLFEGETRQKTLHALQTLGTIANELGCTQSQLVLAWTMYNKDVSTAICGATRLQQMQDNIGALEVLARLDTDVLRRIDQALDNEPEPRKNFRQGPIVPNDALFNTTNYPSRRGY